MVSTRSLQLVSQTEETVVVGLIYVAFFSLDISIDINYYVKLVNQKPYKINQIIRRPVQSVKDDVVVVFLQLRI